MRSPATVDVIDGEEFFNGFSAAMANTAVMRDHFMDQTTMCFSHSPRAILKMTSASGFTWFRQVFAVETTTLCHAPRGEYTPFLPICIET
jgi:hypothetical protein